MFEKPHVFDEGWVPEDLHSRRGKADALAAAVKPITAGRGPNPILVSGPPGAGKTATARWVLDDLAIETRASTVYIDAWDAHHTHTVYAALLEALDQPCLVNPTTPHRTLRQRVRDALEAPLVVVLDEADQLDDLGVIADLDAMDAVAVVLIVNDPGRFRDRLQRDSADIEFADDIPYDPYGTQELVDILEPRERLGLSAGACPRVQLEGVARRAEGNARTAIQGLSEAASHANSAGRSTIAEADVEAGIEAARERFRVKTRSRLTRHERVVLEVLEELGEAKKGVIYEAYVDRVGEEDARGSRRVGDYLSKLVSYNQIEAEGEKRGRTYRAVTASRDALIR